MEIERISGGHGIVTPFFAGFMTGAFYKSTSGPRGAALAAVFGAVGSCAYWYGTSYFYDVVLGRRGRF